MGSWLNCLCSFWTEHWVKCRGIHLQTNLLLLSWTPFCWKIYVVPNPIAICPDHSLFILWILIVLQWEIQNILINNAVELFSFIQSPKYIFVVKICPVSGFFINILFKKNYTTFIRNIKNYQKKIIKIFLKIFHKLMS